MLVGITENGELRNVKTNEKGELKVVIGEEGNLSDKETTLISQVYTLGVEKNNIEINRNVTSIMIANYSGTANTSIIINDKTFIIGSNLAVELPVNTTISNLIISANEENAKVQIVVKGVE